MEPEENLLRLYHRVAEISESCKMNVNEMSLVDALCKQLNTITGLCVSCSPCNKGIIISTAKNYLTGRGKL
jgi:hypothetical protein